MATRAILTPLAAEFPASSFPGLLTVRNRAVLAFDDTAGETCFWTLVAPQGLTGALTVVISLMMASATTGGLVFEAGVEAVSDSDTVDLDAGGSFAAATAATLVTVPSTAGYMRQISITPADADGIAAGDLVRILISRVPSNGADTATGDCYVLAVELRDAA